MKCLLSLLGIAFLIASGIAPLHAQAVGPESRNIDSLLQLVPSQKDSVLVSTYDKLFYAYINKGDLKKAYSFLEKATPLIDSLNNKWLEADFYRAKGIYYINISDYQQALTYNEQAKNLYAELDDKTYLAVTYNHLGIIYKYLGKTGMALEAYLTSLKIYEAIGVSEDKLTPSIVNIGVLYSDLGNLEVSNEYYKKAEAICLEYDRAYCLALTRSNRATNLAEANELHEALKLYKEALPYFEDNNLKKEYGEQYNLMAAVYIKMDSLDLAEEYINKSMITNNETGEMSMMALAYRNLGDVMFKKKNFEAALENYQRSLGISKQTTNNLDLVDDYLRISDTYEKLGNVTEAYEYRKLYFASHDTLFNQRNREQITALEVQYKTEKSEQEIELQKKEIALLEEKQKAARLQRIGLITGLLATILFFGLGYYALRQKMKRNRLERERVKAELAFKKKELTTHALHLAKKNEVLESLKQKARELKATEHNNKAYHQLIQTINLDQQDDKVWENFTQYFEAVHKDFAGNATKKYPDISRTELRLMALIKMNLSSKEIANILNISSEGVKKARQRLRKKMDLSRKDSLENTIMAI